jgi:hypothetical protein
MNVPRFSGICRFLVAATFSTPAFAADASVKPVSVSSVPAPESAPGVSAPGGIGLEKVITASLDRGDYIPKPQDDRTPLIVRLESVQPGKDGKFDYVFRYLGFEPGTYRLSDYLMRPDGAPATASDEPVVIARVSLSSILPDDFKGELNAHVTDPFPGIGGYRRALAGGVVLWIIALPTLLWFTRRKKVLVKAPAVVAPATYAERMRPLVEAAAAGRLAASGQAELERLMTGYWREKLGRPELRMAESLVALKAHPEAGALLLAMERWLHRPGGASPAEIENLLKPYGAPATDAGKERGA